MEILKEFLMNAEIAFSNKQYNEALNWYQKVLSETPDDIYALSRAGAICVPLGKFEDALKYFGKAKELDPENGDNFFNYANACFFCKDYKNAFSMYVEAEQKGCSDDVTPRLYYQLAMICSMRQDIKSSLAYFKKCEDSDKDGMIAINPDLISEKLKLFMIIQDYENAEKCAAQLVAIQPTMFKNYMVYYSVLMAHKRYSVAEKVLDDAEKYAELTNDDCFTIALQKAALWVAMGEINGSESIEKAIKFLESYSEITALTAEQKIQVVIALAEAYLKVELYDRAILCLNAVLSPKDESNKQLFANVNDTHVLSDDEIESMIQENMALIQGKIDCGEIDENIGMYAEIEYDEEGNERHIYDESIFSSVDSPKDDPTNDILNENVDGMHAFSIEIREKIQFLLLSAFLGKEDFVNASRIANVLQHSDNKYYSYYGMYTSALVERKINGNTISVDQKYAKTIAYFRNKAFENSNDFLASIFRARLYAEQGKKEKAKEIAQLLSDDDKQAILAYIDQC